MHGCFHTRQWHYHFVDAAVEAAPEIEVLKGKELYDLVEGMRDC